MIAVRWCPTHGLVLEECWEGLRCPAGHDWFTAQQMGNEFWVVDMEFTQDREEFLLWRVRTGNSLEQGPYYKRLAERELLGLIDAAAESHDYVNRPQHWAKARKKAGHQWTFLERVFKGRA